MCMYNKSSCCTPLIYNIFIKIYRVIKTHIKFFNKNLLRIDWLKLDLESTPAAKNFLCSKLNVELLISHINYKRACIWKITVSKTSLFAFLRFWWHLRTQVLLGHFLFCQQLAFRHKASHGTSLFVVFLRSGFKRSMASLFPGYFKRQSLQK